MQCSASHLRYYNIQIPIQFEMMVNWSFFQEAVAEFPALTQSLVPVINEDWSESTYLPPWAGFTQNECPNVNAFAFSF